MSGRRHGGVLVAVLVGLLTGMGCERDLSTSQGVVEEFLDQHYVSIDLNKSKDYTIGLARKKVDDEIRLTAGLVIDAATRKPRVYYELVEKRESRGRLSYLYELTIRPEDADELTRRVLIRVQQHQGGWRVSNFLEY